MDRVAYWLAFGILAVVAISPNTVGISTQFQILGCVGSVVALGAIVLGGRVE